MWAAAGSLAACAAHAPLPPVEPMPAPAMPPAWQVERAYQGEATNLTVWWEQFGDPLLPRLIESAERVSPTLASAVARIEQARAAAVAVSAGRLPQVDAVATASRGRNEVSTPAASVGTAAVQASWELDLFGAVKAGADAGAARLDGAQAAWHATRVSLAAEVASAYLSLRSCEAQARELRDDVQSRAETARVTARSAAAGLTPAAAAAQARASAAQGHAQWVALRTQCDAWVKALVGLSAQPEAELRQQMSAASGRIPQAAPFAFDTLPARLLAQRPDLAEAAAAVAASAADVRLADARRMPRVGLSGSLGFIGMQVSRERRDETTWSLGPLQVSFPLFDGGVRRASAQAARAGYDEAVSHYQARLRLAVREVEEALLQVRSSEDRRADVQLAAQGYDESMQAADARFKGGVATLFEFEDARRAAINARMAVLEWQRDRTAAWISLYRALGGGWHAPEPGKGGPGAAG